MTEKIMLGIGIRLLGLYLLISGIAAIPDIFWFMESEIVDPTSNIKVFALSWHAGLYIIIGYVFLFKGTLIAHVLGASNSKIQTDIGLANNQIIQLMGVFLLVTSIGPFIKGVIPLFDVGEIMVFDVGYLISTIVSFFIGLVLFIKPSVIGDLMATKKGNA